MNDPYYQDDSVTLYHGDCLDILTELPDESIDAVVTDPPYGLEFMGKEWDGADGFRRSLNAADASRDSVFGRTSRTSPEYRADNSFQQWCTAWATECLRVLKPGGHLLAFGGSRTWHRMACAIEDAGFEIRDSIAWLYGCHDDQTEVLTRRGWVNGLDLTEDDDVAQWATDGTVSLVRPTARQRYSFDGRMVRFRNVDVDQFVTPNHRVYRQTMERQQVDGIRTATWSDWHVNQAADINRWQPMRVPAAGLHHGPGIGGTDYAALLGWVWAEGGFDLSGTGVRVYQSSVNQPFVDEISALLDRLGPHKRYDYLRTYTRRNGEAHPHTATTWFVSGDLAMRVREDLPGKAPTWPLLWRMTVDEKRAFWGAAMKGDGSKATRSFWQKDRATLEWVQALLAGIGCRGKIADDPRGVLHWTDRDTIELQRRHLIDDGEQYTGEVWCVTVTSGAFIIRRNGKVSVSGNSGFPKSLDVSKAIDKAAGAEREVLETIPDRWAGKGNVLQRSQQAENESVDITAPATDAARQWSGWGTAMKPAFEPIVCARKPLNPVPWDWRLVATVHHALAGLLWLSLSDAKRAEIRSASKNHALPEAWCVSALVSAATGTSLDESAKTATFNSQATASTCWNIVSSWSAILGALSDPTSTCTTSMKSSTTTGLRTLNSLLAPVISLNTMPACECLLAGRSSRAPSVASSSSEEWDKWTRTLSVSAPASAIEGIALAVRGALAAIADDFSSDLPESIAQQTATTGAGSSKGSHAFEPIVVARKPLGEKTVAANVLEHGTGALNIDGCRVEANDGLRVQGAQTVVGATNFGGEREGGKVYDQGRWPANTLLDPFAAAEVDEQSGISKSPTKVTRGGSRQESYGMGRQDDVPCYGDTGGASRFFPVFRYEAKAPTSERPTANGVAHPTVKPIHSRAAGRQPRPASTSTCAASPSSAKPTTYH